MRSHKKRPNYGFKKTMSDLFFNLGLILAGLVLIALIIMLKAKTAIEFSVEPIVFLYTTFVTTFQLSRVVGAMFHKKSMEKVMKGFESTTWDEYEPTVTFVIPCKNEETVIRRTIENCYAVDYPRSKIEVIAINDGSTDGTLEEMQEAKREHKDLVIVDWEVNRGKRQGMAEGIRRAKGEIVVQLDSDSFINPKTFRGLVRPFKNPRVGAVSAHTRPQNSDENLLTKMQTAYYFVSFRILKAAESTFMKVFCCSGCCSAYRRSVVLPVLNKWVKEKFLGLPVTWGDDRALTNCILRKDYITIYSEEVEAFTIVPNSLKQFLKQQVRWKKGWFVNSVFATRFILRKDPFVTLTYFFPLILITLITPFMAIRALLYNPLIRGISPIYYILGVFLMSAVMTTYYRHIERKNKYWPYVFVWSAINMVILSFVLFYALFTIQNRKWGTR
ncbi:hypothetical protein A3K63_04615 [Candidatus Micrarchaeota archaeon RBG_16_49_10]|nr:MAG: hypothetical protein A3K63_04615 [Candidatus Micrarchaeota archaeon RBG_16_49_10]